MRTEKQLLCNNFFAGNLCQKRTVVPKLHEIEPSLITNIIDEEGQLFVGRGSFGIVRIQLYRNINVAVKEFLPHTVTSDVKIEANILAKFSHPYLPYLFGIVIKELPYRIVMQYHGISGYSTSVTLHDTLSSSESIKKQILMFCCQLVEALHCESFITCSS